MAEVDIKNIVKRYGDAVAVSEVSLQIRDKEFVVLVGPSGCGKTTFLNMLGGLDQPTSGSIQIGNTPLNNLKESELIDFRLHNIGFVFQAYNLIPVLTAKENVEFIMQLQGKSKSEMEERAKTLLSEVGLGDRIDSKPSKLSGGQQQRVAVARALASKPKFVLADEPTANLDSKSTETLLDLMEKLNREEHITFILSTHDDRVVKKARRIIRLEDGKIISDERKA